MTGFVDKQIVECISTTPENANLVRKYTSPVCLLCFAIDQLAQIQNKTRSLMNTSATTFNQLEGMSFFERNVADKYLPTLLHKTEQIKKYQSRVVGNLCEYHSINFHNIGLKYLHYLNVYQICSAPYALVPNKTYKIFPIISLTPYEETGYKFFHNNFNSVASIGNVEEKEQNLLAKLYEILATKYKDHRQQRKENVLYNIMLDWARIADAIQTASLPKEYENGTVCVMLTEEYKAKINNPENTHLQAIFGTTVEANQFEIPINRFPKFDIRSIATFLPSSITEVSPNKQLYGEIPTVYIIDNYFVSGYGYKPNAALMSTYHTAPPDIDIPVERITNTMVLCAHNSIIEKNIIPTAIYDSTQRYTIELAVPSINVEGYA